MSRENGLRPPKLLDTSTNDSTTWEDWLQSCEWYETAVPLLKKPPEVQVATFMSWWQAPANQGQKFALCRAWQVFSSKWLPIRNTCLFSATKSKYFQGLGGKNQPIKARSLFFAAHGKCFQVSMAHKPAGASSFSFKGLGGKHQPIKARSLFFAAHGKCFQVSMAHKPAGASSFSFKVSMAHKPAGASSFSLKDLVYFTWLLKVTATWTQLTANLSSSFHGLQASKHQFVFPQSGLGQGQGQAVEAAEARYVAEVAEALSLPLSLLFAAAQCT
ncbi:hypothetical protein ISCGN_019227 [Ixodes scapularis]